MAFCENVPGIDRSRDRHYDLNEQIFILMRFLLDFVVKSVLERNEFYQVIDSEQKHFRDKGFSDKVHCSEREPFALSTFAFVSGKEYHRYL